MTIYLYCSLTLEKDLEKNILDDSLKKTENSKKNTLDSEPNAEEFYMKIGFIKVGQFETSIKNRFMPIMEMDL